MIIREIYIDGFGIFNGFSIKNLDKGINILLGENEAGKSTLLKFFKYTLFGYPRFKDQRMPPVHGGSHGGRIKAILSTNKEVVFERKGDDKIALFYDGNTSGNETQWLQFLGNATKDIYENVFAFSLDELLGINSLSVSGVEDKIFSIGSGMGNISIGEIINDIQSNTDQIYSQRGSKQIIPVVYKSIQDKKAEIKLIQENLPKYQELTAAIRDLKKEITDLENKLKEDRNRKGKLNDYLKCYENFVSVVKTDEELAGLPEPQDYPKEGPEKLKELEKEEKSLNDRIDELLKGSAGDQGIGEIEKELESISFNSEILAEKAKVNYLKTNLEKYKQTISDRSEDRGKIIELDSIILEKLKAINSDWTRQDIIDFSNLITHQDRIKTLKEDLDKIKNEKIELKGRKEGMLANAGRINPGNALTLISLVFLLASVPAFYYSLYVPALICVVIALLIFFGRRYLIKEDPVIKIDEELSEVENKEKEYLESYGDYLEKELNLERNLSADSVLEILKATGHLKKDIGERDDLDKKQKEMRDPFIKDFENTAKSIGYLLRNKEADSGIETLVIQIAVEFDFAESQSKRQKELEDSLSRKKKELERNRNNLTRNNQLVSDLLKSVNAGEIDDFRKKYEVNSNVLELIQKKRTAINTIETIAGINMTDDVIDFLKTHEQAALREDVADLEAGIELTTGALNFKNTELGEKRSKIEQIEGESELAEKMTGLETERQRLADAYKEWMTGKIALKILTEVREKYEKEKQPVIIQNSGRYFKKITGERYERIHVALEKREITVFDSREASKTIDQLSRATREQLLVSLRLGFIEEYETNAEPLPVVVDDILVNFDPKRAQKTADILQEFGENRQVIIFSCHPSTKEYFKKSHVNLIKLLF
jgi:uncharacterized protein YhaN